MGFDKYLFSFFTIILVHFTCYGESGFNGINENNLLGFYSDGIGSSLLRNDEDTMLKPDNYTQLNADDMECKCENGRCETGCADWKNGACRKTKQVCVCDPEFGKYDDHKCIYCDCGKGFNCTIDKKSRGDSRVCTCPEGFYDYSGECAPFCSADRPCRNGGTCKNGRCDCRRSTHGPFCERIFHCAYECRPRLIVDCVYNQEEETFGCLCKNKSLVFDYDEMVCKPCPCGEGTCTYDRHDLKCNCKDGYKEFRKQCRRCDCGHDSNYECEILRNGEKQCKCPFGFFSRDGACIPCGCGHVEATCRLDVNKRKICICPESYEDNLGVCEKKKNNCTCHFTAKCSKTSDGFDCTCEEGYRGETHLHPLPGEPCIDIDECENKERCPSRENQKCVNFPGSYMCQCQKGYKPVNAVKGRITCEKYKPSWAPTGITVGVIVAFIAISVGFVLFLKYRETSRLSSGIEMSRTR